MHPILLHIHQLQQSLYTADWGLSRTRYFLHLLGNPHHNFTTIHIAGTSGKTSTATMIAQLLHSAGILVGLTVSPHIESEKERLWVNGKNPSEDEFDELLQSLLPALTRMQHSSYGLPTYFEFLICAAFVHFARNKVTYAVVETGLGGLFDSTNVIDIPSKIAVITPIGFDHQAILGTTLQQIATQKAGIIHAKNVVFSSVQKPEAAEVLVYQAKKTGTHITWINEQLQAKNQNFIYKNQPFTLKLLGDKQIQNAHLALEVATFAAGLKNVSISPQVIQKWQHTLSNLSIPARVETRHITHPRSPKTAKTLVIDGAHNSEKMQNITSVLADISKRKPVDVLLAIKKDKNSQDMIKQLFLTPNIAWGTITCTQFSAMQDVQHHSISAQLLANQVSKMAKQMHINCRVTVLPQLSKKTFHQWVWHNSGSVSLVVGSLYLASIVHSFLAKK